MRAVEVAHAHMEDAGAKACAVVGGTGDALGQL
jgi:hypothetical protein